MGTKAERIYHITSARRALSEDVDDRTTRYLFTMTIRTVCLIACALVPGWYRWLFAAGAILLPMLAVMVANAGREPAGKIDETAEPSIPPPSGPVIDPDGTPVEGRLLEAAPDKPSWFHDDSEFLR